MSEKSVLKNKPYGNCYMYAPDGKLLCPCTPSKISWYLSRHLAEVYSKEPLSIKLKFVPKAYGNYQDEFYLLGRENKCVVCGAEDILSKHHIIPKCYRKHFPLEVKHHSSHDVVLLCPSCHKTYEKFADELKVTIANENNAPFHNKIDNKMKKIKKISGLAHTLLNYWTKIPSRKREEIMNFVKIYLKKEVVTHRDLEIVSRIEKKKRKALNHSKTVVKKLVDLEKFVIRWRKHFVTKMNPKYLPEKWDIYRKLINR